MIPIVKGAYGYAGQVVVVTGGASGIGLGIVEMLAEAGAKVVIADINVVRAREEADRLAAAGHDVEAVALDLTDEASIVAAFATIVERHDVPWALVNNAGLQDRQLLLDGTASEWDRINTINARGAFLTTREAARAMVAGGGGGRIVNIASTAVIGPLVRGHAAYAASKAALLGLTSATALEVSEHAITANTILPGGVATPGAIGAQGPAPDGPARRRPPLGMCTPRDIGATALFLCSPLAGAITNQALAVDGGWSIT